MKWNLGTLKEILLYLNDKKKEAKNETEIAYLNQQIDMVEGMINYILYRNKKGDYNVDWIASKKDITKKAEFVARNLAPITLDIDFVTYSKRLPHYSFCKKNIDTKDFLKLVEKFLSVFEFPLSETYEKLKNHEGINISDVTFFSSTCLGITSYFPALGISYIDATFKDRIDYSSYLPHEIAHAYQLTGTTSKQFQSMGYSALREAFPHFVELAFIDFLKHTKYFKAAMNMEREYIESIAKTYELDSLKYENTLEVKVKNSNDFYNDKNERLYIGAISRFISKLLACYLIQIYRENSDGVNQINQFNQMYLSQNEYDFFYEIGAKKIAEALKNEFGSYYADIANRKKFEIVYKTN